MKRSECTRSRSKPTRRCARWMACGTTNGATHQRRPRPIPKRWTVQFGTPSGCGLSRARMSSSRTPSRPRRVSSSRSYVSPPEVVSGFTPQCGEQIDSALIASTPSPHRHDEIAPHEGSELRALHALGGVQPGEQVEEREQAVPEV